MDGSSSAFLRDPPLFSGLTDHSAAGILYIEDFDLQDGGVADVAVEPEPAAPALTANDVELARQEGHASGMQAALHDARLMQTHLQAASLQSVADALDAARSTLERVATQHAAECARAMLAVLQAAVPAVMARNGACEVDAVLRSLLPGLAYEPELRVHAHPELADIVRESLYASLPKEGVVLSVAADPQLAAGDIRLAWRDGQARRDCAAIWEGVRAALAPLELPSMKEICHGH